MTTHLDVLDFKALDVQVVQSKERDCVPDFKACGQESIVDGLKPRIAEFAAVYPA